MDAKLKFPSASSTLAAPKAAGSAHEDGASPMAQQPGQVPARQGETLTDRLIGVCLALAPLLLIAGLLYAAFFVKPTVSTAAFAAPSIQRGEFMYGVTAPAADLLWAAGSSGKVWRSEDGAKSWALQATPSRMNLQDIAAWNPKQAVAVGDAGVVLRTEDGGLNWLAVEVPLASLSNKLMRVRLFEDGSAWTVGEGGSVLRSGDFGRQWQRVHGEADQAWNDIHQQGERIWLAGEFGRIEVSKDGAKTWASMSSPVKTSLMAIAFRDANHGVAVGVEGVILVTRDGGAKWIEVPKVSREHLFDLLWDGAGWLAVGDKGVLLRADAQAMSWQFGHVAEGERAWHTKLISSGKNYVLAGEKLSLLPR